MGSIWLSKKAFLYFGGAAILLLGGVVVIMSPYHYIMYSMSENIHKPWSVYDKSGYYPQVEVFVSVRPINVTIVNLDLVIMNNSTSEITTVNMTIGPEYQIGPTTQTLIGPHSVIYEYTTDVDLPAGNYTVWFDRIEGASILDLGLNQASDSRLWVGIGGFMNFFGLGMIIVGYFVKGTFLPSDVDTIVDWGYDENQSNQ